LNNGACWRPTRRTGAIGRALGRTTKPLSLLLAPTSAPKRPEAPTRAQKSAIIQMGNLYHKANFYRDRTGFYLSFRVKKKKEKGKGKRYFLYYKNGRYHIFDLDLRKKGHQQRY